MPFICSYKLRCFLLLFFILNNSIIYSQPSRSKKYEAIDDKILVYGKKENLSIDSVIAFVNREFKTTEEKVRAYYTYISLNITYDLQRLDELMILPSHASFDGPMHHTISQKPEDVFEKKKGICEGISRLMVRFCQGSGIKAHMVVGHYKPPDGEFVKEMGHAWNAVKLDSAWALLDITWSFGYVNYKREFVKNHSGTYFLEDPEKFLQGHLPMEPMWQLTQKPILKKYFITEDSTNGKYYSVNYNFNDTITAYFKKNDYEKKYSSLLNYYLFDVENINTARNLDVFINNQATDKATVAGIFYDDFVVFYNTKLIKYYTKSNCRKALEILNNSNKQLKMAQAILKNKKALTPEFADNFKRLDEDLRKNAVAINKNIQMIKQAQKQAK